MLVSGWEPTEQALARDWYRNHCILFALASAHPYRQAKSRAWIFPRLTQWGEVHTITEQDQALVPQRSWFQNDGHQHGVQFYSADKFLIEELSRYVSHALHAGDAAIVVATEEHREGLIRRLTAQGVEVGTSIEQGRFIALDAARMLTTFMIEGWPDQQRFSDVVGGVIEKAVAATDRGANPRVAIYGEMVALLWDQGKAEAAIRLEQLWNDLARSKSFFLFCAYPISSFSHERDADLLMKVCGEHSVVIPTEGYTVLVNEDDRRRTVVQLQQKAKALETEVAEHKRLRQELELRVQSRTAELQSKNVQLLEEIRRREGAEISLRTLTSQLLLIRDEERRRVAHELHESTAQVLATLAINLSLLEEPEEKMGARDGKLIEQSVRLVDQLLGEVRQLSDLLHPPTLDEMGLSSAILWYTERFSQRNSVKVTVDLPEDLGRFSPDREIAAFRVVQESLTNVQRHSGSATAAVRVLKSPGRVRVEVTDRGKGMPSELALTPGVGISGMRERVRQLGGLLSIHSDGKGTTVTAELPL
jgi:signal transduction histidine kinase